MDDASLKLEDEVLAHLDKIAHHVRVKTAQSQAQRKAANTPAVFKQKLSKKQIDHVVAAINKGDLKLPDLKFECNEDYLTVLALADTGSAAHVANRDKHFPGAVLRKSKGQAQGLKYVTADGGEITNNGEFGVIFKAPDGHLRRTTFQNAKVGLPHLFDRPSGSREASHHI